MGEQIIYVDEYGKSHFALVTQIWDGKEPHSLDNKSAINLVYVSSDETKTDQYGRQIERYTSVVHRDNQSAHGRYWYVP